MNDAMSPKEKADLEVMRKEIEFKEKTTFNYMRQILRMDRRELDTCGFRNMNTAEALQRTMENAVAHIDRMTKAHVKRYPD